MPITPEKLKALRRMRAITCKEAAKLCEVHYTTYLRWEAGRTTMPTAYELLLRTRLNIVEPEPEPSDWPAERIAAFRENLDLTQKDFGEMFGVGRITVYQWEHGLSRPSAEHELQLDMADKVRNFKIGELEL